MRLLITLAFCAALFAQPAADLNTELRPSRERIDAIDRQIIQLLNERAQVVHEVGVIKQRFRAPASAPSREKQVLERVRAQARAPLTPAAVEAVYKVILEQMTAMEAAEIEDSRPR
jgi:chorismate mutase / prephenate dehydratase